MQNRDRHLYARRFNSDRANSQKKKLPRRERIAKLIASRFSSAIKDKGQDIAKETESRINERKKQLQKRRRNASNENTAFAQQSKRQGKRPRHICIPEELEEEEEEAATAAEESVRPSTTLGRPKGPNFISALERNFKVT